MHGCLSSMMHWSNTAIEYSSIRTRYTIRSIAIISCTELVPDDMNSFLYNHNFFQSGVKLNLDVGGSSMRNGAKVALPLPCLDSNSFAHETLVPLTYQVDNE